MQREACSKAAFAIGSRKISSFHERLRKYFKVVVLPGAQRSPKESFTDMLPSKWRTVVLLDSQVREQVTGAGSVAA